jgi:chromate reductase, NAD(P)H dehydrogenase (quinone)
VAAEYKVIVMVGSLRKESYSKKIARALPGLRAAPLQFEIPEIGNLPLYNEDLDGNPPAPWVEFRQKVNAGDALLFITPEYNRSVPGCLKNAIDVASRPYGQSVLDGKPGAIISNTPYALGAFGANHHLRQSMVFLNVPTMQQPEAYLGGVKSLFDSEGNLTHSSSRDFLAKFLQAFAKWIEANKRK